MPRIFNPATHNVSATEYIIRNTSPLMVVAMFVILMVWTVQELQLRDAYPVDQFKKLNHVMNMLEVVWGALVTGYLFHFIVDHRPQVRREYEERRIVEREVLFIFNEYQQLLCDLLRDVPRSDLRLNIYRLTTKEWETLLALAHKHWPPNDQLDIETRIAMTIGAVKAMLSELGSHRFKLDHRLSLAIRKAKDSLNLVESRTTDKRSGHVSLIRLTGAMRQIYEYVDNDVRNRRTVFALSHKTVNQSDLQAVWNDVEANKQWYAEAMARRPAKP